MAKKQKTVEVEAQEVIVSEKKRLRIKKMKYHPVARFKGCKNCE